MDVSATVSSSSSSSEVVGDGGLSFRCFLVKDRGDSVDSDGVFLFKNPLATFFGRGDDFFAETGATVPFSFALDLVDGELVIGGGTGADSVTTPLDGGDFSGTAASTSGNTNRVSMETGVVCLRGLALRRRPPEVLGAETDGGTVETYGGTGSTGASGTSFEWLVGVFFE